MDIYIHTYIHIGIGVLNVAHMATPKMLRPGMFRHLGWARPEVSGAQKGYPWQSGSRYGDTTITLGSRKIYLCGYNSIPCIYDNLLENHTMGIKFIANDHWILGYIYKYINWIYVYIMDIYIMDIYNGYIYIMDIYNGYIYNGYIYIMDIYI